MAGISVTDTTPGLYVLSAAYELGYQSKIVEVDMSSSAGRRAGRQLIKSYGLLGWGVMDINFDETNTKMIYYLGLPNEDEGLEAL